MHECSLSSRIETHPPSGENSSLEVVSCLILEQAPFKIDLVWIRGLVWSEWVLFVTKKAFGVGRRGRLEIRDLEIDFFKTFFAFTHTQTLKGTPVCRARWKSWGVCGARAISPASRAFGEGVFNPLHEPRLPFPMSVLVLFYTLEPGTLVLAKWFWPHPFQL